VNRPVTVHAIDALPAIGPAAVCMGVFDGVHRGHVALAGVTARAARERGAASVALVFEPHPDEVVRPGTVVPRLAPIAENLRRLAEAGIDHPLVVHFDTALRALEPAAFLAAMSPALELRALVMTPESAFGRNRAGTPSAMRELGPRMGFELVLAAGIVEEDGEPISSARVRAALMAGDVALARRLLGHSLHIEANLEVADGAAFAVRLDYPAALPGPGRYGVGVAGGDGRSSRSGVLEVDDGSLRLRGDGLAAEPVSIELPGDA
jgi:riboflavin kinase / FMN adenylyltransferase